MSYGAMCDLLERISEERGSTLEPDLRMSVEHYVQMVRRRILGDPEIVELSRQIYQKHERAIELVYRNRPKSPNYPAQIYPIIEDLIEQNPKLAKDLAARRNIKFGVKAWDDAPAIPTAEGWTDSRRILLFVVYNESDRLDLHLSIGPGPEIIRRGLFEMAANHDVFVEPRPNDDKAIRARTWPLIFTRHLLKPEAYEKLDQEQREQEIRKRWDEFLDKDLPRIEEAVKSETWIWEPVETDSV
jgi:hypothetical protein